MEMVKQRKFCHAGSSCDFVFLYPLIKMGTYPVRKIVKMRPNSNLRHKTTAYLQHFKNKCYVELVCLVSTNQNSISKFT
jgi:hypothetical protein